MLRRGDSRIARKREAREPPLQNILAYTIIESNYKLEILRFRFASLRMTFVEVFQLDKYQFIILPVSADIAE